MNREEYMRLLAIALKDVPQSEKEEALQYYNDYFDDAGVENEQEVMKALGSPAKLAESIQKEFVTGEGKFEGYRGSYEQQPTYSNANTNTYNNPNEKAGKKNKMSGGLIALIVILTILASPLILALAAVVIGVLIGIFGAIFGVIVSLFAVILTLICVVIACITIAFSLGMISPFSAVVLVGIGIASIGICIFLVMAIVWLFGVAIPWVVTGIGKLFKKIFGKKGGNQ